MSKNIFNKSYICLIQGFLNQNSGTINLPIARKPGSIIERCIDKNRSKFYYSLPSIKGI